MLAGLTAGVVTTVVTDRPSVAGFAGLGALALIMIVTQVWLAVGGGSGGSQTGAGSVWVGGSSSASITTDVSDIRRPSGSPPPAGRRTGAGSVRIGRNAKGSIRTRARNVEEP